MLKRKNDGLATWRETLEKTERDIKTKEIATFLADLEGRPPHLCFDLARRFEEQTLSSASSYEDYVSRITKRLQKAKQLCRTSGSLSEGNKKMKNSAMKKQMKGATYGDDCNGGTKTEEPNHSDNLLEAQDILNAHGAWMEEFKARAEQLITMTKPNADKNPTIERQVIKVEQYVQYAKTALEYLDDVRKGQAPSSATLDDLKLAIQKIKKTDALVRKALDRAQLQSAAGLAGAPRPASQPISCQLNELPSLSSSKFKSRSPSQSNSLIQFELDDDSIEPATSMSNLTLPWELPDEKQTSCKPFRANNSQKTQTTRAPAIPFAKRSLSGQIFKSSFNNPIQKVGPPSRKKARSFLHASKFEDDWRLNPTIPYHFQPPKLEKSHSAPATLYPSADFPDFGERGEAVSMELALEWACYSEESDGSEEKQQRLNDQPLCPSEPSNLTPKTEQTHKLQDSHSRSSQMMPSLDSEFALPTLQMNASSPKNSHSSPKFEGTGSPPFDAWGTDVSPLTALQLSEKSAIASMHDFFQQDGNFNRLIPLSPTSLASSHRSRSGGKDVLKKNGNMQCFPSTEDFSSVVSLSPSGSMEALTEKNTELSYDFLFSDKQEAIFNTEDEMIDEEDLDENWHEYGDAVLGCLSEAGLFADEGWDGENFEQDDLDSSLTIWKEGEKAVQALNQTQNSTIWKENEKGDKYHSFHSNYLIQTV